MNQTTARLKQKLEQLTALDTGFRIFGAKEPWGGHEYRLYPTPTAEYLESWERHHDLMLPEDYKEFLLHISNGGAGSHYGMCDLEESIGYSDLTQPFPFAFERTLQDRIPEDWSDALPGIIRLNDQGSGYFSFLVVKGESYGTVWTDWTAALEGLEPTYESFSAWYEDWLDRSIGLIEAEQVLQHIQPGMSRSQVISLVGRAYRVNKRMDTEGEALVFEGTASSVLLNPYGQVEAVHPDVFA